MSTEVSSACGRLQDAYLELLREMPYQKITVRALIERAGVNRATFYQNYENTEALVHAILLELADRIAVPPPFAVTDASSLEAYAKLMMENAAKLQSTVYLLSAEHGDILNAYRLATMVRDRLRAVQQAANITGRGVEANVELSAYSMCVLFMNKTVSPTELCANEAAGDDVRGFQYDIEISFMENTARYLAKARGGSPFFHYNLICAELLLMAQTGSLSVNVTALLETAGSHRTEFYRYYKNIADFSDALPLASIRCFHLWCGIAFRRGAALDEAHLRGFIRNKAVIAALRYFFMSGTVNTYFPQLLSGIIRAVPLPPEPPENTDVAVAHYVSAFILSFCRYLLGLQDHAAFLRDVAYLRTVSARFNAPVFPDGVSP